MTRKISDEIIVARTIPTESFEKCKAVDDRFVY